MELQSTQKEKENYQKIIPSYINGLFKRNYGSGC